MPPGLGKTKSITQTLRSSLLSVLLLSLSCPLQLLATWAFPVLRPKALWYSWSLILFLYVIHIQPITNFSQLYFSPVSEFDHFSSFHHYFTGPNCQTFLPGLLQCPSTGLCISTLVFPESILQVAARMTFLKKKKGMNKIILFLYWKPSKGFPSCSK